MAWHPTLDSIEGKSDAPWTRPAPVTDEQRRVEAMRAAGALGGADCWCGQQHGHDWEGKDDGAPHPR